MEIDGDIVKIGTKEQEEAARAAFNDPAVQETLSEADQIEVEKLKTNADISAIIAGGKVLTDIVVVNGVSIRFTPFLSRTVRHKISVIRNIKDGASLDEAERVVYLTLALLCKDEPYTKEITWRHIDAEGGDASNILAEMMGKIKKRADQMRNFQ
jgi:hypothetical protein